MTEHLGESTRLALAYAKRIAMNLAAGAIEPEHVFLGIADLADAAISDAFADAGGDLAGACARIRGRLWRSGVMLASDLPWSDATSRAIETADGVAARLGASEIEAPVAMIGILTDETSLPAEVLEEMGTDPAKVCDALAGIAGGGGGAGALPERRRPRGRTAQPPLRVLSTLGRDLTAAAASGEFTPIVGREEEIEELVSILLGRRKNNALLVGDPGVGKTAIVEALAQRIVAGEIVALEDMTVHTLEVGALVAGTVYRGQFEQRLKDLVDELRDRRDIIVFIDEMHMLVGAGETGMGGSVDAANMLKPVLSEGSLRVVGATTHDEYRKYLEPDGALMRRFQLVLVGEPSRQAALAILAGLRPVYEEHHGVSISDDALEAAVDLSVRHLHERNLPDKAIDLIDRSCTAIRLRRAPVGGPSAEPVAVGAEDVASAVAQMLDIPVARLTVDERQHLAGMAHQLKSRVLGQDAAVDAVATTVLRARTGVLRRRSRPSGVFLFLGPTGVGKTMLAHELAAFLFGSGDEVIELDMSQYTSHASVSELIGSPRGFVGADEGGKLTNAVRKKPYSVVVLDEFEKADLAIWNLFLPIFDTGRCQDAMDRTVDFRDTLIIATSNIGSRHFSKGLTVGFRSSQDDVEHRVLEDASTVLPPEVLNRFDEVVVFKPLDRPVVRNIVRQQLADTIALDVDVSEGALELLTDESFDPSMGARPVRRALQRLVANPLSLMLARGELVEHDRVSIGAVDSRLTFARRLDDMSHDDETSVQGAG